MPKLLFVVLCSFFWLFNANEALANVPGLVKPNKTATLSAFQPGAIVQLDVELGQKVKQGQRLLAFDCELPEIDLQTAIAQFKGAELTYQNNQRLFELSAIGRETLSLSQVDFERASAEQARAQYIVSRCEITAPFSGVIQSVQVRQFEYVEANTPLLTILDDSELKVEFLLPITQLDSTVVGDTVTIQADNKTTTYTATITHLAPSFDAVSQTRFAEALVKADQGQILPGTSVKVGF